VLKQEFGGGICVSTAHPGKFEEVIRRALGFFPEDWMPDRVEGTLYKTRIPLDIGRLERFLLAYAG
jgi:threonine synthase